MNAGRAERIELVADAGAAAAFAAATFFALANFAALPMVSAAAGIVAFWAALRGLRAVRPHDPGFALADFIALPVEAEEPDELLLTDSDRLPADEELLLIDADRVPADDELLLTDA